MDHTEALKVQKGDKVFETKYPKSKHMAVEDIQIKPEDIVEYDDNDRVVRKRVDVCYFYVYLWGHGHEWCHEKFFTRCDRD